VSYNDDNFLNTPFLLQKSSGQRFYFFLQETEKVLRCCIQNKGEQWSAPNDCLEKINCFSAIISEDDTIHLIAADIEGNILHKQFAGEDTKEGIIYINKGKELSHVILLADEKELHLVYLARSNKEKRWWIIHHRFKENRWFEPQVVDFGSGPSLNYPSCTLDSYGRLHLVYRFYTSAKYDLFYRQFQEDNLAWSPPVKLNNPHSDNHFPSLLRDENGCFHLLWSSFDGESYRICYRRRLRGGWPDGRWQKEIILSPPATELLFPTLFKNNKELVVLWQEGEKIYRRCSPDSGGKWTEELLPSNNTSYRPLRWAENKLSNSRRIQNPSWIYASGSPPLKLLNVFADLPDHTEGAKETDLELFSHFQDLKSHSQNLVQRAAALSRAKLELEKTLEGKNQELLLLSQRHKKQYHALQSQLQEKNKELEEIENNFNQTLTAMREKIQSIRRSKESELQKVKKEREKLKAELEKKEKEAEELKISLQRSEGMLEQYLAQNLALEKKVKELEKELEDKKGGIWGYLLKKFHLK
jgi:hypothetical protein